MLYKIFSAIRAEQDTYEKQQIERIVALLWYSPRYSHCIDLLPASWWECIEKVCEDLDERERALTTKL